MWIKLYFYNVFPGHLLGTSMALELGSLRPAHSIQGLLADHMPTLQQLRRVRRQSRLLCHRANKHIVELEVGT